MLKLNNAQANIMQVATNLLNDDKNKDDLLTALYDALEGALGKPVNRSIDSNNNAFLSAITDTCVDLVITKLNQFVAELMEGVDALNYNGLLNSSYTGARTELLNLENQDGEPILIDAIALSTNSGARKFVVFANDDIDVTSDSNKQLIASAIFRVDGLLPTDNNDVDVITTSVTASTGQVKNIGYYQATARTFKMQITYYLDSEQVSYELSLQDNIKLNVNNIFNEKYKKIGKDFIVQDFQAITYLINGIGKITIRMQELDSNNDPTGDPIIDTNITIASNSIFILNDDIEVARGE